MTDSSESAFGRLKRYRWVVFAVLAAGYFFVYFHRMSVSVVGSDIVADVGGTIGVLSSVYFWTYTAMQIPCGLLTDRFGPRAVSSVFLLVASVGSLLTSFGDSFAAMVVGKMLIAAGMAVVYVPLMKLVSVWFPKRDYAVLSGIVIAVGNVGAIAASGPLSLLADAVGWRDVFLILGVITMVLALACALVIMRSAGQYIPPAGALAVLPMIIPAKALLIYPAEIFAGASLLMLAALAIGKVPAGKKT